ncbi:hypothetical protein SEVIR_5G445200v4 [Setaria viridis]|uniref:Uncharacterized protein n=1 Tax=Setaria viridis TaxID=4556 RepID=A0A4V6D7N4_SETVI|nr:uncharacterized protein LOC117856111 [Setaria viridis]TKW18656.1 hypothetical protein SEVIR_5G445200v2 [Setaria viridis]
MVPTTRNLLHHDGNSSGKPCYHPGQYCVGIAAQLEASAAAARQQDHRKPSRSTRLAMGDDEPAAAAGTSSQGGAAAGDDEDWLQLSLAGVAVASSSSASSSGDTNSMDPAPHPMELDLLTYDKRNARMRPPLFPLPLRSYQSYGRGRYRPAAASGSLSAPSLTFTPPFRTSGDAMRVISPPRRRETAAGLWLKLQAAPNQVREPILPQIPKSYLRIKDSNMKVEVVMKYLAEKLGISRSHQVELTCRGQLLHPFLLVKHVRDSIWCSTAPREEETLAELTASRRSPAATADHVMTLCYSTTRNTKLVINL